MFKSTKTNSLQIKDGEQLDKGCKESLRLSAVNNLKDTSAFTKEPKKTTAAYATAVFEANQ